MKRLSLASIAAAALFLYEHTAFAQTAVTLEDYPACLTEEFLDDFMTFAAAKDIASADAYVKSRKCIVLKGCLLYTSPSPRDS